MHILVADDKSAIVQLITELLDNIGYTVESAVNGLAAFELAQKKDFDLYIIDHLMPVMNGVKLVTNLKMKTQTASTPILFITTQDLSLVEKLEEYPMFDAVLAKPINKELFYRAINQFSLSNREKTSA